MPDITLQELDRLITLSQCETGTSPVLLTARGYSLPPPHMRSRTCAKSPKWTVQEDEYLRRNLGLVTEEEMASHLGRTVTAVHLRWKRDLDLPAPSKDPRYITANQAGKLLQIDPHKVTHWVDSGLLPGETVPGGRKVRRILRITLLRWLCVPKHWMLFDANKIREEKYRGIVLRAQASWSDEWWSVRQAADHHGVTPQDVLRNIYLGKLDAMQVSCLGGRHPNPRWAHWYMRRSDALKLVIHKGRGRKELAVWSQEADVYLILASAVGLSNNAIARSMKWTPKRVVYRLKQIQSRAPELVREYQLPVTIGQGGKLFADWGECKHWFPAIERSMKKLQALIQYPNPSLRTRLNPQDRQTIRSVLRHWAAWHNIHMPVGTTTRKLLIAVRTLRDAGTRALDFVYEHNIPGDDKKAWHFTFEGLEATYELDIDTGMVKIRYPGFADGELDRIVDGDLNPDIKEDYGLYHILYDRLNRRDYEGAIDLVIQHIRECREERGREHGEK